MKILHIASHRINMGDGAIVHGIQNAINNIAPGCTFYNKDITDYDKPDMLIDIPELEEQGYDLVLVGGGGTIDGHRNRTETGTALRVDLDQLRETRLPFAFVGLGHNLFPRQEFHHVAKLQEFVDVCREKGFPFSVRDDGSKERLSRLIDVDYIQTIPDPGFFIPVNPNHQPVEAHPTFPHAVIQLAGDNVLARYGDEKEVKAFLAEIANVIDMIIDTGYSVVLAIHTANDMGFIPYIPLNSHKYRYHVRATPLGMPINAPQFFRVYQDAEFIIGTRGHAVICGAGLRKPTVAISTHDKVGGFMDKAGLNDASMEIGDFSGNDLLRKVEHVVNDGVVVSDEKLVEWTRRFDEFLRVVLKY